MKLNLIAVGKRMPKWVDLALTEYIKRLPKNINFNLNQIAPEKRSRNRSLQELKKNEDEKINTLISSTNIVIALDEKGELISSHRLAGELQIWIDQQLDVGILIGGADGLSDSIKNRASKIWSLSKMTLPHALARVIFIEQLYRASTILNKHPYHRE
ncbi:MAG: 23S rRNA (pseudouridine(1915)-N(3))-methyltransferase RlmH [Legionellales bacterium]|mgnify:FL=1|jgi:23S rRNA (pseudouridine1915-N3)-methyltransferase|nr:23S rRNA (pseudouridine(1915)-N(3))-methyltransferase RlmH [Legionellales bacterium]|tara:strand:+ start:4745 stop:5215 length:471 start_codon:yes stop_codon:yes gene_type:complete